MSAVPGGPSRAHVYVALDGLRGIAALAVVVYHARDLLDSTHWLPRAYLAVDLFFLLSGFVLDHAYAAKLGRGLRTSGFMRLRLERLYPAYAIATGIALIAFSVAMAGGSRVLPSIDALAWSLTFAVFFLPTPTRLSSTELMYPLDPAAWSLCFELLVNLLFAAVFRYLRPRVLAAIVLASAVAVLLRGVAAGTLDEGSGWSGFATALARVLFSFFAGVALHRLHGLRARVPALPFWMVSTIVVASFAVPWSGGVGSIVECVCVLVVYPLVIASASRARPRRARWCERFGALSYPLYVLHTPLLFLYTGTLVRIVDLPVVEMRPWAGVGAIVVIVVASAIVERYGERPILDALKRRRAGAPHLLSTAGLPR